ncbi:MAG: DUF748 domain-containing protein [Phycisphaerae bacterium]
MATDPPSSTQPQPQPKKKRRWPKVLLLLLLCLALLGAVGRLMLPRYVRWYVNRTLDKSPVYQGRIGDIDVQLLHGGYVIHDVEINKTTGNVPVPFFSAKKIDLHLQWSALIHGKIVGQIAMVHPQLNFVDSSNQSSTQSGSQGPWLEMIRELFPFQINSCILHNGEIHFRAFDADPPVDVSLNHLEASIDNLSNIHNDTTPLVTTVEASGLAMDTGKFDFHMKLDPFSYKPSFELALRLVGLDVTEINALSQAYGKFDFKHGYFDLVVELNAKEGELTGYVKPLFRDLTILDLSDLKRDNPLQFFWQLVVGTTTELLTNHPRDQFGTLVPLSGTLNGPQTNIFATIGNVLRNAFIRAYLPRFEGTAPDAANIHFGPASPTNPIASEPPNSSDMKGITK